MFRTKRTCRFRRDYAVPNLDSAGKGGCFNVNWKVSSCAELLVQSPVFIVSQLEYSVHKTKSSDIFISSFNKAGDSMFIMMIFSFVLEVRRQTDRHI